MLGYDRGRADLFAFLDLPGPASEWTVCAGCGFVFQNPRPTPDRIVALYASGRYRARRHYSEHFFRMRYRNPLDHIRWFRRHVPDARPRRVIDIGAGHGGAVRAFRDLGVEAEGVELDPELVASARARFGVELIAGDFLTQAQPPAAYDLVYSSHTHEHFDDFVAANQKIHRLLKPGGHLLLVLPTHRCVARNGRGFLNVVHNSIFTARSLRNMLVQSGFEPVAFRYPMEHSRPEVWGIGRRADGVPVDIKPDWPALVRWEIHYAPHIFEALYRVTDVPVRAARALERRAADETARELFWNGGHPSRLALARALVRAVRGR